ncbi:DNA repair exonuclease SbcCD ATPase subunit [Paenibacillus sp. W4I10]|uniref:AAA family ATPase n=1 Tax=Paenibacillus sp. W4I10 TaxID=3042298 RepID=UPI002786FA83|nr:AAA family ATPase [Paenibacillus sp. W4I10]MDQ0719765.1 DNA repair exonuclease SbcCD ATPase subunit [Paenibacillus sp. W4I10]
MRQITLISLILRNFKGLRDFVLEAEGRSVSAYGDNATGKTTLFDGFVWTLFGKDSQNRTDFEIKGLDEAGKVAEHGLQHEVEAVLMVDRRRRSFKKVFAEKWTRKRGQATGEFSGHTTDYYVDGVPVKQGQYKAEVDGLISEDIFKLLTSPSYFNEILKPDARRKVLLEVCGEMTDAEIIASSKQLAPLADILGDRSLEDHRKVIAARRTEINKELEKIPVRIDEARHSMPDVSDLDVELLQEDIETMRGRVDAKTAELQRIQSGGELSAKEIRLREINAELTEIKQVIQADGLQAVNGQQARLSQLRGEASELQSRLTAGQREAERYKGQIVRADSQVKRLRAEWTSLDSLQYPVHEHEHDANCPTCGQSLPDDQVQSAKDKALEAFNLDKSKRLEAISADGKLAAAEKSDLEKGLKTLEGDLAKLQKEIATKAAEVMAAEATLQSLQSNIADPLDNTKYQSIQRDGEKVRAEIEQLRSSSADAIGKVQSEIRLIRSQVDDLEADKAKLATVAATEKRITELSEEERKLAGEFEKLEHELFLTEEFTRTKVSMLESKINSKFRYARFRLFEEQINGGLKDVCKTLYNGVPYEGGLNNAARINVGLDIINTLGQHYGFSAPIFVDNAEAVTQLIDTDAQVIRLVVSEGDKKLRLEHNIQEAI